MRKKPTNDKFQAWGKPTRRPEKNPYFRDEHFLLFYHFVYYSNFRFNATVTALKLSGHVRVMSYIYGVPIF